MPNDPRALIERLCEERGEDFAGLSRMLGRNNAYIQQYVRRGTPRKLHEDDRRKLAAYFGLPEADFGGPAASSPSGAGLVEVRRSPVRASAGPGAIPGDEAGEPYLGFSPRWLKALTQADGDKLAIIRAEGDSMMPTVLPGDDLLIDRSDCGERLRDGIYVLRVDEALVVKRLAIDPMGRTVTIQSDNPAYRDWPDVSLKEIHCIGRVIWVGRKLA